MQSLPLAYQVEELFPNNEKTDALLEYSKITADNYKQDEILSKIALEFEKIMGQYSIEYSETAIDYCNRMVSILSENEKYLSAIRNRMYLKVLCACLYINGMRFT